MEVVQTPIEGVLLIKPKVWGDARGYFVETWQQERYAAAGISLPFVQDNHSMSAQGILRGLHYQKKRPQGKLVYVSLGSVFDVELSQQNQWQMWVTPGLAHGFVVTSEIAHFHYKCTDYYCPENEAAIRWNDPAIGIDWPVAEPRLSAKDSAAPSWAEAMGLHLPE